MMIEASLLGGQGTFLHWGVVQISLANLVVIGLMAFVFVVSLLVPFHRSGRGNGR